MSERDVMIRLSNLSKRFGLFRAIEHADFDIFRGEFFSILGASGSGKTTLLRIMAGFEAATEGAVHIDDAPMDAVPPHQRPVNMVFQNYAIFPHLNVADNIGFGLRKLGLGRAERQRRIDEMLELIALPGYGARRSDQLSGGQRQRVALARALILRPKVLLLDEPLGALDKQLRAQMQTELRALQRTVGITFVLVTHDQEEAMALSDRVAVMDEGRVLQIDTPAGLYERPGSRKVAGFIGSMNFLRGAVLGRDGALARVQIAGGGAVCRMPADRLNGAHGDLDLAIRPEKIALHARAPGPDALAGVLRDRVFLGERVQYTVALGDGGETVIVSAPNTAETDGVPQTGSTVWLSWPETALMPLSDT